MAIGTGTGALAAPAPGDLGLGLLLGDPTAGTAKYFLTKSQAVDFGVGVSEDLTLIGDYVFHGWDLLPQSKRGELSAYASLGARLEMLRDTDFGVRTMLGLSYWPHFKRSTEFFLELGPAFRVAPYARVRIDGGFGLRVYFAPLRAGPKG
ncbi:MAG: hypothetical protein HY077_05805 [Elusimicrobia bacterium]|nr:hypothetical protein [Elusimicrobiota bacterium]